MKKLIPLLLLLLSTAALADTPLFTFSMINSSKDTNNKQLSWEIDQSFNDLYGKLALFPQLNTANTFTAPQTFPSINFIDGSTQTTAYPGQTYYERKPNPTSQDFTSFSANGSWQGLNCSSIVPVGTKAVYIQCIMTSDSPSSGYVLFRSSMSTTGAGQCPALITQVSGVQIQGCYVVPCNANRWIETYCPSAPSYTQLTACILGWWK